MNITPLSEGSFTIGHDKVFMPFEETSHHLNDRAKGALLVEIQPFLIQTQGLNILLDTGLGFCLPSGGLQIHHNLEMQGLEPNDIDMVLLSHLHKDHAGGIFYTNNLGISELCFPNATYYVGKREFDFGMEKAAPSYLTEDFDLLKNSSQIEWLDDVGAIHHFISYETDGGHCPYHISFLIKSEGETLFYGGDVAPQLKQLKTKYIAKYDYDGRKAMELRQQYAQNGKDEDWTFLFYHDIKTPYSKI